MALESSGARAQRSAREAIRTGRARRSQDEQARDGSQRWLGLSCTGAGRARPGCWGGFGSRAIAAIQEVAVRQKNAAGWIEGWRALTVRALPGRGQASSSAAERLRWGGL